MTVTAPSSGGMRGAEGNDKCRQAVVLIHGIGEQRPMDTLRSFVDAFLCFGTYYNTLSQSYELRRIKLRRRDRSAAGPDVNRVARNGFLRVLEAAS